MRGLLMRSLTGAVLVLVILLLRVLLHRRLPKGTFRVLWIIALFHHLLPVLPYSPLSLYNLWDTVAEHSRASVQVTDRAGELLQVMLTPQAPSITGIPVKTPLWPKVLFIIWLIGVLLCAIVFLIGWVRSSRRFRQSVPVTEEAVLRWQAADPKRNRIVIRQCSAVDTPLACGLLRLTILLPMEMDTTEEGMLRCILAHEEQHLRRGDLWLKLGMAALFCIYWYSPAVWLLRWHMNRDIELACDEAVLRKMAGIRPATYAMALIRMEECRAAKAPLASGFAENALEARITAIMKPTKVTKTVLAAAVVLCLCVTIGFAATGEPILEAEEKTVSVPPELQPAENTDDIGAKLQAVIKADPNEVPQAPADEEIPELEPEREAVLVPEAGSKPAAGTEPASSLPEVWYWPVPVSNNITARFGARIHPITGEKMVYDHITVAADKDVLAAQSGKVMEVYFDKEMGNVVEIDHGNSYVTVYGHLAESTVHVGQYVEGGAVIGTAGRTGMATGNCLAFWVKQNGTSIDPMQFYNIDPKFTTGSEVQLQSAVTVEQMLEDESLIQYYAYLDLKKADESVKPLIEAARKYIIHQHTWAADDSSAKVLDRDGKVIMTAPRFHDIFPADWEIPKVTSY